MLLQLAGFRIAAFSAQSIHHPVQLFFIFTIGIALWSVSSSSTVVMAGARVVPPNPYACDRLTHTSRVHHTIPPFSAGGQSCLTVSANLCTYQKGLQITLPASAPPPGMNPLVRILIYQSSFLSPNSIDPALFIQSTSSATSQQYRLEVVIANSTIRAEWTDGGGTVFALQFSSIHFTNANITLYGSHVSAVSNSGYGLVFSSSPITNSTFKLLSSTIEAIGSTSTFHAISFSTSPLTGVFVNITASLINVTSGGRTYGLSFASSHLLRSTVRLFDTHIVSQSTGANVPSNSLVLESSTVSHSTINVYGGSIIAMNGLFDSYAVHITTLTTLPIEISNGVLSFHGTVLAASSSGIGSTGVAAVRLSKVLLTASTIEVIGGSMTARKMGSGSGSSSANVLEFGSAVANASSTIRTNGTTIACESTAMECVFLALGSATDSLVGVYGASLGLRGGSTATIWKLIGSAGTANTSFVLSRCGAVFSGSSAANILFPVSYTSVGAGNTLFWHHSSYTLNGGPPQQLPLSYRCNGITCASLALRINDSSTPLVPSTCPYCLAPYGAPIPFGNGSVGSDTIAHTAPHINWQQTHRSICDSNHNSVFIYKCESFSANNFGNELRYRIPKPVARSHQFSVTIVLSYR